MSGSAAFSSTRTFTFKYLKFFHSSPTHFQKLRRRHIEQQAHLVDGDFVEPLQPLVFVEALPDKFGVQVFEVRQRQQMFGRGVVAEVALFFPDLPRATVCGQPEQCQIEQIGLRRKVQPLRFGRKNARRDQMFADGIGVDQVIDFCQRAAQVPVERVFLLGQLQFFQPLKFLDQIQLERRAEPITKPERQIFVCKSATAEPSAFRNDAPRGSAFDPFFGRYPSAKYILVARAGSG